MNWPAFRKSRITFEAVLAGQHDIQDHQIEPRRSGLENFERGFTRIHNFHLVAFRLQVETQAFGQVLLVFHHQNPIHFATGNCRVKVLPRPGPSLSAQFPALVTLGDRADDVQPQPGAFH